MTVACGTYAGERLAREIAQLFRRLARPCVICPSRLVVADIYRRGFGVEAGDIEFSRLSRLRHSVSAQGPSADASN